MTRNEIVESAGKFVDESPHNCITAEVALHPDCVGMKIFENPIFAFGPADDELYMKFKSGEIIGDHFLSPAEWLPGVKTVISFFLPYTREVKASNSKDYAWPSIAWLHGRYEGQLLIRELQAFIEGFLSQAGYKSMAPSADRRFKSGDASGNNRFTSNWSERHVAYACGLGTFGLSKGIITEKGMCGRFGSILTELDLPKDSRNYSDIYEYCSHCGACVKHCPASAISLDGGKEHLPCSDFLDKTMERHSPRYGCGKCQVKVPCESGIPLRGSL